MPDEQNGRDEDPRGADDYSELGRLAADLVDLGGAAEGLGRSLSALGPDLPALERDQVAAFFDRWRAARADADLLLDELQAEALALTSKPIRHPPWHL